MDIFKNKQEENDFDPLRDLTLSKMKVGYYLDYDMKTWQVTAYNRYDYGDGYFSDEWELTSAREIWFLEREEDDEVIWTLSKKLPLGAIEGNVTKHIIEHEDPPNQIVVKGKTYYLDESGSAYLLKDGKGPGVGFVAWDFIDEDDQAFVTIEQWGEEEFEAAEGFYVEEYQFSNILPGGEAQA
jgi:hypothetical protein